MADLQVLTDSLSSVSRLHEPHPKRLRRSTATGDEFDLESCVDSSYIDERTAIPTTSIVKIYTVHTEPNYALPWTTKHQISSTATLCRGCVVLIQSSNEMLAFSIRTRNVRETCVECDV